MVFAPPVTQVGVRNDAHTGAHGWESKTQNKLADLRQCLVRWCRALAVLEITLMGFPGCSLPGDAVVRNQPELETRWLLPGRAEVCGAGGGTVTASTSCAEVLLSGPAVQDAPL